MFFPPFEEGLNRPSEFAYCCYLFCCQVMPVASYVILDTSYLVSHNPDRSDSLFLAGSPEKNHGIIENMTFSFHLIFLEDRSRCFGFDTTDKVFTLFLKQVKTLMKLISPVHNTGLAF